MSEIKLPKLPERTPSKLSIWLPPDLSRLLEEYAAAYEAAYGQHESVADLVPHIVRQFLASDRAFIKSRETTAGRLTDG